MKNSAHKPVLQMMNILFFAILSMTVIFGVVVFFITSQQMSTATPDLKGTFNIIVPGAFVFSILISSVASKAQLRQIDAGMPLADKLKKYQSITLIKCAPIEAAGVISSVATLITGELYFLAGIALALVIFLMIRPTLGNIANDLNLSGAERAELEA